MNSERIYKFATYFLTLILAVTLTQSFGLSPSTAKTKTSASTCTTFQYDDQNLESDPEIALCIAKLEKKGFTVVDIVPIVKQWDNGYYAVFYLVRGEK